MAETTAGGPAEGRAALGPLAAISRHYGADPAWVLAGGGNTSYKTADRLYVKASGFALGTIDASGFCEIDRARLDAIWSRQYPGDKDAREDAVLADLMAARAPGETKRPSVETLLHGFFPQAYVVHTHPAIVNGLTCSQEGEAAFARLFGGEGIWVPLVDPGYTLAVAVRAIFDAHVAQKGAAPAFMFMQNHGLLVAADSPEAIAALSGAIVAKLAGAIAAAGVREPDLRPVIADPGETEAFAAALRGLAGDGVSVRHRADAMTLGFAADAASFAAIAQPYSPDHIVYAGHEFLRVEGRAELAAAWASYQARNGQRPRVILAKGLGAFSVGGGPGQTEAASAQAASRVLDLFADACKVATYTRAFGGPRFMTPEAVAFIRNWEVEKYRSSVAGR
ncbi:class II aldolase/adducin family protein [bacterium]|nr:class II aldolase/adducin family protein [bacterium]